MYIIAFDLSLNSTGYSIFDKKGKLIELGSIDTKSETEIPLKLKIIGKKILSIKRKYKISLVLIERGFTRFNHVTQKIFRVFGIVNYLFYNVEQIYITSKAVRKAVCKNGNIKKADFFIYIKSKNKRIKFSNDDEADAFALGRAYFLLQKEKQRGSKKTGRSK